MPNTLTYNIASMRLSGTVGATAVDVIAHSGGRGGTKTPGAAHPILKNNPFLTHVKRDEKKPSTIGGPLPQGTYHLVIHEKRKGWIRLIPDDYTARSIALKNRDGGFAIHKRGERGSDGCIVPNDSAIVDKLIEELKKSKEPVNMKVIAVGDIDYYEKLLRMV